MKIVNSPGTGYTAATFDPSSKVAEPRRTITDAGPLKRLDPASARAASLGPRNRAALPPVRQQSILSLSALQAGTFVMGIFGPRTAPAQDGTEKAAAISTQEVAEALRVGALKNDVEAIGRFALDHLKSVPLNSRLAYLGSVGAGKAMHATLAAGSPEAISAWAPVLQLLPRESRSAFLGRRTPIGNDKEGGNSIASGIFSNDIPGAMKAWGELLDTLPSQEERLELLLTQTSQTGGEPLFGDLLERGNSDAIEQFATLVSRHIRSSNNEFHELLLSCQYRLKILTSSRGKVSGKDWVGTNGLKHERPVGLSLNQQRIAEAYGKLVLRATPRRYRNDVLFPEHVWTVRKPLGRGPGTRSSLNGDLRPEQERELAHSLTLLKAMIPQMSPSERHEILNEIRSRHATKTLGVWVNTSDYKKFKAKLPAVDALLLDVKQALKQ